MPDELNLDDVKECIRELRELNNPEVNTILDSYDFQWEPEREGQEGEPHA